MSERFSLDSNILIYAADHVSRDRQDRAIEIIRAAARSSCVLSTQVLGEFVHVASRKGMLPRPEAVDRASELQVAFEVVGISPEAFDVGMVAARDFRYSVWDAILLATVNQAGCTLLLSEDMHDGGKFGGVTVLNPFKGQTLPRRVAAALGLR
ncbi:MAG: PIN domain-containing protein [Alphaproteobacteria bacterium]|nr:PIN domain-containing protein [Alphaproteobacteria bacterium]